MTFAMDLDFDKLGGLLPAVIQDASDLRVLMVGYMNEEALRKTLETGWVVFYSRTRRSLWTKGETSGHRLAVKSIRADCDGDALLVQVAVLGPGVCHRGYRSCFFRVLEDGAWITCERRAFDPADVYGGRE